MRTSCAGTSCVRSTIVADGGPALLFGTVHSDEGVNYNAFILAEGGKLVGRTLKHELPNYGTFDEKRIFAQGPLPEPIQIGGLRLGVPICEDIWLEAVCHHLAAGGAEILLVPTGSPFEVDKDDQRPRLVRERVIETVEAGFCAVICSGLSGWSW